MSKPLIAAALGLIFTALALITALLLPHYRPQLAEGQRYGLDVSNHQGVIDWEAVSGDEIDFAFIKASEGGDFVDQSFEQNWIGAKDAGLDVGAYHFFTLCRSGEDQASNFLSVVPPGSSDLPPSLDLEIPGNCSDRPDREHVITEVARWVELVEQEFNQDVLLYVGPHFEEQYQISEELDRMHWRRRILRKPSEDSWAVWQFSYFADVAGVDGGVDLNVIAAACC